MSPRWLIAFGYIGFLIDIGVVIALVVWGFVVAARRIKDLLTSVPPPQHRIADAHHDPNIFFKKEVTKDDDSGEDWAATRRDFVRDQLRWDDHLNESS